jgi:hypothetical protein
MQPTASRASLLLECPYPFLNDKLVPEHSEPGKAALYGIAFHAQMANSLGNAEVTGDLELTMHVCSAFEKLSAWLEKNHWVKGCKRYVEVSLAYCPRTSTARSCLPPDEETHTYGDLRPDEIGGTADLIVVPKDKARPLLVLDHKTGMWGDFSRPENLPQLQVLGIAACLKHNRGSFVPAVLHSPREGLPIVYEGDEMYIGIWDDGSLSFRLRRQLELVGTGTLRPGAHCKSLRCPAYNQCPAHAADILQEAGALVEKATLVGSELVLVSNTNGTLTREEKIGRLHLLMTRFAELDKRAREEIKRALVNEPGLEPVRPDGKVLKLKTRTVERLSKSSIEKALGKDKGAAMIEKLRAMGAVVTSEEVMLWAE